MPHHNRWTKSLHRNGKKLGKLANRMIPHRHSTSLLHAALFIVGGVAAGFALARYLTAHSSPRSTAARQHGADEFQEPVVVTGAAATRPSARSPRDEEWVSERTEFFAADTSSSPPPASFSTDNPDIPTLYPEDDATAARRAEAGTQKS